MENPLAPDSFSKLAKNFTTSIPSNFSWFIQFELWGGHNSHISSIPADATAYPHRNHHWTVQFYGRTNGSWFPQYTEFVDGLADTLAQGKELGAYANYLDPYLRGWKKKYYDRNYAHLEEIRKKTDPSGVFLKSQSIGAAD
jgi:hypothetical protein